MPAFESILYVNRQILIGNRSTMLLLGELPLKKFTSNFKPQQILLHLFIIKGDSKHTGQTLWVVEYNVTNNFCLRNQTTIHIFSQKYRVSQKSLDKFKYNTGIQIQVHFPKECGRKFNKWQLQKAPWQWNNRKKKKSVKIYNGVLEYRLTLIQQLEWNTYSQFQPWKRNSYIDKRYVLLQLHLSTKYI